MSTATPVEARFSYRCWGQRQQAPSGDLPFVLLRVSSRGAPGYAIRRSRVLRLQEPGLPDLIDPAR